MAQNEKGEANQKAAFIYNFAKYIDWPEEHKNSEFVIGILGASEIDLPLLEIARNNKVKNKKIIVTRFNKPSEIGLCNMLFIPKNSPFLLQTVLEKVAKSVLVISETPGMAKKGTAFNFVTVNDKLRFEVNQTALYMAGLRTSSQLLKLAIIVN